MLLKNFSFPTKYQWKRIALNSVFVFIAQLIFALQALGFNPSEPQLLLTFDLSFSVFMSAVTTAFFATIKTLWTLLFEAPVK